MGPYQIIDEPQGGKYARFTVNPMWPLLAFMLGGPLFSWFWSGLNSFALNSPTRTKELTILAAAFIVYLVMYSGIGWILITGAMPGINVEYIKIGITCVFLVFCYWIYLIQSDAFEVYEYFNGLVATPAIGLILAFLVGRKLESLVIQSVITGVQ